MNKQFDVRWCKTYNSTGVERVTAATAEEAEQLVSDRIGDLEGSMQYEPDWNEVEASPAIE